jgi:hypothetical protein
MFIVVGVFGGVIIGGDILIESVNEHRRQKNVDVVPVGDTLIESTNEHRRQKNVGVGVNDEREYLF